MSDAEDIEEIRQRKREALQSRVSSPSDPVYVESDAHFDDVLASHQLVLVDFYADWCGPCKMLEPTVDALAAETEATVAKVDIDAHQGLAQRYQVQGVPTLYLFVEGEPAQRMVGVQDKATLTEHIERHR